MSQERIVSFFYLKIFFVILILLLVGAIIFRIGFEIKTSTFRNNSFSLLLVGKDSKLLFVDKKARSVSLLSLGDIIKYVKGKNTFEASLALGIPINGIIIDDLTPKNINEFTSADYEMRLMFGNKSVFKNLNRYDIYKLTNAVRGAIEDNRTELRIDIFDQKQVKDKLSETFNDSEIRNSTITVEINNGTTINGLGSILALILAKEGYNIIAVRTVPSEISSFIAFNGEKNSYLDSLSGLTGFDIIKKQVSPTADVTIFLGEDTDAMLSP